MQAIVTYFVPCTNYKPSRIRVKASAKNILISWSSVECDSIEDTHRAAAMVLINQLGWNSKNYGELVTGSLPDNGGFVHVLTGKKRVE